MPATEIDPQHHSWTAAELLQMPRSQRDAILSAAAARAEDDYRYDRELTDFEAFGQEDLHGCSSDTRSR